MTGNPLIPLQIHNLNLSIQGKTLLRDIHLDVQSCGVTALLGYNGAGKSLLMRVLHGLTAATSGAVTWGGQSITQQAVRQQQSMVFQKPVLLRRSVKANIDYVLNLHHNNSNTGIDGLLELAGLTDKAHQAARTLSGGEQQRLAFVRALACNPSVMFLDEPTANLDPDATLRIEHLIRRATRQSIKIFLVTHDTRQARRLAEDIIFLHRGRVAEFNNADGFFNQPQTRYSKSFIDGVLTETPE